MTIRVLMKINEDTSPELYADLQRVSPRRRGERLRLLATLELREKVIDRDDAIDRVASEPEKKKSKVAKKLDSPVAPQELPAEHGRTEKDAHSELRTSMISGMKNQF